MYLNVVVLCNIDDKKLAQHCYIKSLTLNSVGNPIAWSNLGFLYLSAGHVYIAHQCFTHAQSIEPGYGRTWIGMVRTCYSDFFLVPSSFNIVY